MSRTKRLTAFTTSYSQAAVIFPYILVAPAFFAEKVQLGGLTQTASAFGSVQTALSIFVTIYRTLADWRASSPVSTDSKRRSRAPRRWQKSSDSIASLHPTAARRSTCASSCCACPTARRWSRPMPEPSRRRTHAAHRPVGLRQIDAVPRHRRHLAVRQRLDRHSRAGVADDAAAAALLPDRHAAWGDRLSRRNRKLQRRPGQGSAHAVGLPSWPRGWKRKRTGTGCSRPANSSASGSRARCCTRRISVPRRGDRLARRTLGSRAVWSACLKLPETTIVSIGHRSTLEAFHQRHVAMVRDGDRFTLREAVSAQSLTA